MKKHSLILSFSVGTILTLGAIFACTVGRLNAAPRAPFIGTIGAIHTPDFYFFAQKQAELYRGELLTRSEMNKLVQQLQAHLQNSAGQPSFDNLRTNPYDLDAVQAVLNITKKSTDSAAGHLHPLRIKLETHRARLISAAEAYQA